MEAIVTVPAIIAVVNLLKGLGMPAKYGALASLAVGIAAAMLAAYGGDHDWTAALGAGIILGLSASGLYDVLPGESRSSGTIVVPGQTGRS